MRLLDEKRELMRMEHNQTTIYREGKGKTIVQRDDKGANSNSPKEAGCAPESRQERRRAESHLRSPGRRQGVTGAR